MTLFMKLQEKVDYYMENGNYVFTAHYLQRRGYCCGSRCRHCPYSPAQQAEAIRLRLAGKPIAPPEARERL